MDQWTIGTIMFQPGELSVKPDQLFDRDVDSIPVFEGDTADVDDRGIKTRQIVLQGVIYNRARFKALRDYATSFASMPLDVQQGLVVDDCEDTSLRGGTWTAGNGATTGTTTTKKVGAHALFVKGGTTDYPYAEVTFTNAENWTRWDELQIWLAPLNDDSTPATGLTARVTIYDSGNDYVYYDKTLSETPNQYLIKRCQLNASGGGDPPTGTSGTMNYDAVKKLRITGQYTADNKDLCWDHILLTRNGDEYNGKYSIKSFRYSREAPWEVQLGLLYVSPLV